MNFIDITPYVEPERVLNFNFSTQMLFRCIEKRFAQSFIKGEIRLSQPSYWIGEEQKGNKGKGDILEGTFLSTKEGDKSDFINKLKQDKNINYFDYEGYTYFRKNSIEQLYCLCFYGLNDNSYTERNTDNYGKEYYTSRVRKEFFESFSERISKEEYLKKEELDRPAVLFISNPHELFERIRKFFMKFGISEQEIIISPVQYLNKKKNSISVLQYPKELLLKDLYYENQSEIRIIINTKNKAFLDYMKNNNNIINIGNIEDIAEIYDYYFDDLIIERKGKNVIEFNLPNERIEKYEDMSLERLLTILAQAYTNNLPDSLINEKEKIINIMKQNLKSKYNIDVEYNNGSFIIYNASDEIIKYLEEYSRKFQKS